MRVRSSLMRFSWRLRFLVRHPNQSWSRLRTTGEHFVEITPMEIHHFIGDSAVILEAGAADGEDTFVLANCFSKGTVIALEPVPKAMEKCKKRTSHLQNVIRIQAALSDVSGAQQLYVSSGTSNSATDSSSLLTPSLHKDLHPEISFDESLTVDCFTLDDLIEHYGLPQPNVLWLDLQGMELRVLEASPKTVANAQIILAEGSRTALYSGAAEYSQLSRFLVDSGFKLEIEKIGAISGNALFVRRSEKT